jgi:hypothetical protein
MLNTYGTVWCNNISSSVFTAHRHLICGLIPSCELAVASDKVYQLLAHGQWFCAGTPASSTTITGRHDIAEILLKVALNTN